jgi:hypothetical protein
VPEPVAFWRIKRQHDSTGTDVQIGWGALAVLIAAAYVVLWVVLELLR